MHPNGNRESVQHDPPQELPIHELWHRLTLRHGRVLHRGAATLGLPPGEKPLDGLELLRLASALADPDVMALLADAKAVAREIERRRRRARR